MANIGDVIRFIVTADGQPFRDDIVKDEAAVEALDQSARNAGGSGGGMGLLGSSIMALLPLLSPLSAAAGGALIGLAGMATTAGAGFVGLGLVAKSNLSDIFAAQKTITAQQTAYNNAVNDKQRQAAMQKAKAAWDTLDVSQQKALMSLQGFQKFWDGFSHSFETPVLNMFTNGLTMAQRLLTLLGPTISAAGGAFAKLEADASKALGSPFWAQFFKWMSKDTAISINSIGVSIGNIMKGLAGMFMAFSPGQKSMEQGLINLTKQFADWGASLGSNSGFQKFVQYFQTQGPKVMSLLGQLGTLIINLLVAMAPLGSIMLTVVTWVAKFVNNLLTLNPLVRTLLGAIIPLIGIYKLLTAAQIALSVAMDANPIGLIILAIGALIIWGSELYKNWDKLTTHMNIFKFALLALSPAVTIIIASIKAIQFVMQHWAQIMTDVKNTVNNVWSAITEFFKKYGLDILLALTGPVGQMVVFLARHWTQIVADARKLGSDIGQFFANLGRDALNWGKNLITMFVNGWKSQISMVENAVKGVANTIKHWLGFHSPSAGLPDSDQWAPNFMKMFAAGIDENRPLVDTAMQKTTKHMQAEAAKQQKIAKSMQTKEQSIFTKMKNAYQSYSDEMTKLRANYQKQEQAINDKLIKNEEAVTKKYTDALNQRTQELQQSFGLFSQVTHKSVSAQSLLGDIQDQVSTFEGWTNDLQSLTQRGVDKGLIAQLQKAGPQSADEVKAMTTMTNDQLKKYVSLWQQQSADARTEAEKELEPMKEDTEKQIEALKVAAVIKLDQLTQAFDQNAANARNKFEAQLATLAQTAPKAIATAVDNMQKQLDDKMSALVASAEAWSAKLSQAMSNSIIGGSVSPAVSGMITGGSSGGSSSMQVSIQHTTQINAPVYGVNDLQTAIKQGVQIHVVPALQQALSQPARAITGAR